MDFQIQKNQILNRADKSKKGSIDEEVRKTVELVNSLHDYYTTSSCSGRIFLIEIPESGKKNEARWLFMKHSAAKFSEIKKALKKISCKEVWLRQESFILHICCRNIKVAQAILSICQKAGIRRAGAISMGKRILIEVFGTERLDTIVAEKGKVIISDNYLRILTREANKKHKKNLEKLKRFHHFLLTKSTNIHITSSISTTAANVNKTK